MLTFAKLTKEDYEAIGSIVKRAKALNVKRDNLSLLMDIQAAHETCPLKLEELSNAPDADFLHDIAGIINHLNRQTGELEDCFLPRYAK